MRISLNGTEVIEVGEVNFDIGSDGVTAKVMVDVPDFEMDRAVGSFPAESLEDAEEQAKECTKVLLTMGWINLADIKGFEVY